MSKKSQGRGRGRKHASRKWRTASKKSMRGGFQINVQHSHRQHPIALEVEGNITVGELKRRLSAPDQLGMPVEHHNVMFRRNANEDSQMLAEHRTLADCGVVAGSVLHIMPNQQAMKSNNPQSGQSGQPPKPRKDHNQTKKYFYLVLYIFINL